VAGALSGSMLTGWWIQSLLTGLGGGFGHLTGDILLVDGLDDTDGDGLSHVTYGETSKWWVFRESLDAHWFLWGKDSNGGVTRLDELGVVFKLLTRTTINLLLKFRELAGNVSCVAIEDRCVSSVDLSRVVQDDDLGGEVGSGLWWIVLGISSNVSSLDFLDRDVLDVETNVVSWQSLVHRLMVHFDGFDFSGQTVGGEGRDDTWLDDTSFDTTHWNSSNTSDLVNILKWETERHVCGSLWWFDLVEGLDQGVTFLGLSVLGDGVTGPSLVPGHVGGGVDHVVTDPTGNWDEWNLLGVVSDLLQVVGYFLLDFVETLFTVFWLGGVHLVDGDNHLLDTKGESEKGVFTGLSVLGDTGFEFTGTGGDDKDGAISLGGSSDHVLDEISVTWGIDDGDFVVLGFELPESDIDGDTSFTFGLKFVHNPGIFEGTFTFLGSFLFEFGNGTFVNTTALVDQMASSGRFTGIYVTNDNNVDMVLFFVQTHGDWSNSNQV